METQASEIMSNEVLTCTALTTLEEALKIMINNRITGMPVVDGEGKLVGIVSESDLIKLFGVMKDPDQAFFQQPIMYSTDFHTISANTPLTEIINVFIKTRTRRLPVIDENRRLIGIVSKRDLMKLFYYRSRLI